MRRPRQAEADEHRVRRRARAQQRVGAVADVEGRSVHLGVQLRIIRQLRRRQRAEADAAEGHESRGDLELCTRHLTRGG